MRITAIDGQEIIVTDLDLAIMQADDYRHYRHADPPYAGSDQKRMAYWGRYIPKAIGLENLKKRAAPPLTPSVRNRRCGTWYARLSKSPIRRCLHLTFENTGVMFSNAFRTDL